MKMLIGTHKYFVKLHGLRFKTV